MSGLRTAKNRRYPERRRSRVPACGAFLRPLLGVLAADNRPRPCYTIRTHRSLRTGLFRPLVA